MKKRNGHPCSYSGPAKPIHTMSWHRRLADKLSANAYPAALALVYLAAFVIVVLDTMYWRP